MINKYMFGMVLNGNSQVNRVCHTTPLHFSRRETEWGCGRKPS